MKKVVFFSGMKGGVGRSILTEAYASYLVNKGYSVTVIDADANTTSSIVDGYNEQDREVPYSVMSLDSSKESNAKTAYNVINNIASVYIVDCRFNHDYKNLLYLYQLADLIVLPIQYDKMCTSATLVYMEYLRREGIHAPFYLVPNMCGKIFNRKSEDGIASQVLGQWGEFLPEIPESGEFMHHGFIDTYGKKIESLTVRTFGELEKRMEQSSLLRRYIDLGYDECNEFKQNIERKIGRQ